MLLLLTCLPNGHSCALRLSTKILKPTLRKKGHLNGGTLRTHVCKEVRYMTDTFCLFTRLGCTIHSVKSVFGPVELLVFPGFLF